MARGSPAVLVQCGRSEPGLGAQPGNRPGLNLAWREDEVHGTGLAMWGDGKRKAPASGILRAQLFGDQGVGQWGQVCQPEK